MPKDAKLAAAKSVHPPISAITHALTFRVARFNILLERMGMSNFQERFGVTLNEWRIIGLTHALEAPSVADLRRTLLMDKGQLSRIVSGLVKRALVTTAARENDKRVIDIRLTPAGLEMHDRILAETALRNARVTACFTAEETTEFLRLLDKLTTLAETRADSEGLSS